MSRILVSKDKRFLPLKLLIQDDYIYVFDDRNEK